jgi:hypothetical protein
MQPDSGAGQRGREGGVGAVAGMGAKSVSAAGAGRRETTSGRCPPPSPSGLRPEAGRSGRSQRPRFRSPPRRLTSSADPPLSVLKTQAMPPEADRGTGPLPEGTAAFRPADIFRPGGLWAAQPAGGAEGRPEGVS